MNLEDDDEWSPGWCPDCGDPEGACICHNWHCTCEMCLQNHPERDNEFNEDWYYGKDDVGDEP